MHPRNSIRTYTNMSAPNVLLRAEMEVNPRLQNAIAAHHIIQVVSRVVIIIYLAASTSFSWPLTFIISALCPIFVFIIFWIASKCSYRDLRLILVHFNTGLSTLWLVFLPFCIISLLHIDGIVTIVLVIFIGFLWLSSAIFATYGIWKSARKDVLSARLVKSDGYEVFDSRPPTMESH